MKERIEAKIEEIVDYITGKPIEEVTLDDYTVLTNELKRIEYRQTQFNHNKRITEFVSTTVSAPAEFSIR